MGSCGAHTGWIYDDGLAGARYHFEKTNKAQLYGEWTKLVINNTTIKKKERKSFCRWCCCCCRVVSKYRQTSIESACCCWWQFLVRAEVQAEKTCRPKSIMMICYWKLFFCVNPQPPPPTFNNKKTQPKYSLTIQLTDRCSAVFFSPYLLCRFRWEPAPFFSLEHLYSGLDAMYYSTS